MSEVPDNGRVTLAVVNNEIVHVRESMFDLRGAFNKLSDQVLQITRDNATRITALERCEAVDQERWETHRADHQRQFGIQSALSAIAAIIAAVVGMFAPQVKP